MAPERGRGGNKRRYFEIDSRPSKQHDDRKERNDCDQTEYNSERGFKKRKGSGGKPEVVDHAMQKDLDYLGSVSRKLQEQFDDDEDKALFVSNVIREINNKFFTLACTQSGSRILETLLTLASSSDVRQTTEAFDSNKRKMCLDQCASHVTEALLKRVAQLIAEKKAPKNDLKYLKNWIDTFSLFLINNFDDFVNHVYATYVLRTLVHVLDGSQYRTLLKPILEKIINMENCTDMLTSSQSCMFLESVVSTLSKVKPAICNQIVRHLADQYMSTEAEELTNDLPHLLTDKHSALLLEKIIEIASPEIFEDLVQYFNGCAVLLAKHRIANFTMQKLIKNCKHSKQVDSLFDSLSDSFKQIIDVRHYGVLVSFALACVEHNTKQQEFLDAIAKGLNCKSKFMIFHVIANFTPEDELEAKTVAIQLQGSLILQHVLKFDKPSKIVASMLTLEATNVVKLACDQYGSHVIDALINSDKVTQQDKIRFVNILKGHFVKLASAKFGSRTFENIWKFSSIEFRCVMAQELCNESSKLRSIKFGHIIYKKYGLETFRKNLNQWKEKQTLEDNPDKVKKKNMLKELSVMIKE